MFYLQKLKSRIYFSLLLLALSAPAAGWGPQGHRVAGHLTEIYLDAHTRSVIRDLLGDESLADASTWPDRMRGDPSEFWQRQAGPWHYVTVPAGQVYADTRPPRRGDAVTALNRFRETLEDPRASRADRQLAFRFALHIIQDLHQPLHVGNGKDRGGNDVKVIAGGKQSNLHRVWDSTILASAGRSDSAWVRRLREPAGGQRLRWAEQGVDTWLSESASLRDRLYPPSQHIGEDYLEHWLPTVEQRLQQAAVRAAAWFESVLGGQGKPAAPG